MMIVNDQPFVKKILGKFCGRLLRGRDARLFLSRCVVEVDLPRLAIVQYEHDEPFTPVSFELHPIRGVDSCRFHPFNNAVAECMRDPRLNAALDRALRRFLKTHNLLPTAERRTA